MTIQTTISEKLNHRLHPQYLEVINQSHMHNVPKGSESHFKVIIVCDDFEHLNLIKRHRMINDILKDELTHHIHALELHPYSVAEWAKRQNKAPTTPHCRGGFTQS